VILHHPEVCLYRPEIPQNTGNIGRLCAATQCRLHLISPFAFSSDDKNLRRAGLDYWPFLDLEVHDDLQVLLDRFGSDVGFLSTKGKRCYTEMPHNVRLLVFGQETKGLPAWVHERYSDNMWRIPIYHSGVRSLNVANTVSIMLYKQLLDRRRYFGEPAL
jgi:tRNA (cytidine/uridine-2'-O-)-methyltransferase